MHRYPPHSSLVKHHFKISEPDKRQGRRLPLGKGKSATDFNVLKISQDQADKGGSALPLEVSLVRNSSELLSLATIWSFTCSISFQITRAGAGSKLKAKKVERCPVLTVDVWGMWGKRGDPGQREETYGLQHSLQHNLQHSHAFWDATGLPSSDSLICSCSSWKKC